MSTGLRIVIVGGVAGGASAATRARRMNEDAEITLIEKDEHISFANCGLPYYLGGEIAPREKLLVATPELLQKRFRIRVLTRTEVVGIDREARAVAIHDRRTDERGLLPYDRLILAPGAVPIRPPLPGIDAPNVLALRNLADTDRIHAEIHAAAGRRVAVVGAGYIGLEMAEQLTRQGVGVDLIELQPQVLPPVDPEMAEPLAQALRDKGVRLHLGTGLESVEVDAAGRAVAVILSNGERVPTDLVILGMGVRPLVDLARRAELQLGPQGGIAVNRSLQTSDPLIYAVGDAIEYPQGPTGGPQRMALAGPANRAGRLAGEHAATGNAAPMGAVSGTAIVRVFDWTAAGTGLSVRAAHKLGLAARSVTIVANHHAGYFPGAHPLTIKLAYEEPTGRILGGQVVGREGVDKRIDVIATVIAFRGTVRNLADLDLSYAPPFGSAKDPLHLAAFAAVNHLNGLEDFVDADADLAR
ncbi:MAG TPA: FAD-dependent oxidoreductase, partial [Planctomycetaceae bacterium]|nr:FAD-dependent oxidoreductase [Planctomycetaceae bacterium]